MVLLQLEILCYHKVASSRKQTDKPVACFSMIPIKSAGVAREEQVPLPGNA
jgi:hypothetical protein